MYGGLKLRWTSWFMNFLFLKCWYHYVGSSIDITKQIKCYLKFLHDNYKSINGIIHYLMISLNNKVQQLTILYCTKKLKQVFSSQLAQNMNPEVKRNIPMLCLS